MNAHRPGPALGRAPLRLVLPAALAVVFVCVPLVALVLRAPWSRLTDLLAEPAVLTALRLSLLVACAAALLCLALGLPLAWALARLDWPGLGLVRALVTVPLVLPPVVAGVALTAAFGRRGLLGGPLHDLTGWTIPFTTLAVLLAHTFVALPFFVLSAEGALRAARQEYDAVAATLGAARWRTFVRVTLPLAAPGVAAGLLLAWARSLGEFGATITFAGNAEGVTRTAPLLVFVQLQDDRGAAYATSLLLLGVAVAILLVLRGHWLPQAAGSQR